MSKKIRSAKGEMVDFDLLKIKEQISAAPAPHDVQARQTFIEKRLRRRIKQPKLPITENVTKQEINVEVPLPEPDNTAALNEETLPANEETLLPTENSEVSSKKKQVTKKKRTIKQKARPTHENN